MSSPYPCCRQSSILPPGFSQRKKPSSVPRVGGALLALVVIGAGGVWCVSRDNGGGGAARGAASAAATGEPAGEPAGTSSPSCEGGECSEGKQ